MKGLMFILWLAVLLTPGWTLEMGIDKGTLHCSREKGNNDILHAEKGDHGVIVSGGYPSNYSTSGKNGLWCLVHIKVCSTCRLNITFQELSFAPCTNRHNGKPRKSDKNWCHVGCDHIHLHEVDPPYRDVTHRNYFGEDEGAHYGSISRNLKIRHCAGITSPVDGRRFKITYKVVDKVEHFKGMVSPYQNSRGVVKSPNFPNGFAQNDETFTYMIQNLDPYGHIRLVFDDWDIPRKSKVKIYDGFAENSPFITLEHFKRPIIVSQSNMLAIVLSTGRRPYESCCFNSGFKAVFEFVSEMPWPDKPESSCSQVHPMHGGRGIISFTGSTASGARRFYDCVWLIKRYDNLFTADAVMLRMREVLLADGWLQFEKRNTLEIRDGVTSEAPLIARYTAQNITRINHSFTSHVGFYLRLRGGYYNTDKLSFTYTAYRNITKEDRTCPGDFDFMCSSMICIDQELICDGLDHCGDGSDEAPAMDCSVTALWKNNFKWNLPQIDEAKDRGSASSSSSSSSSSRARCEGIRCGSACIQLDQICDGRVDCVGREDEDNCANAPASKKRESVSVPNSALPLSSTQITLLLFLAFISCFLAQPR